MIVQVNITFARVGPITTFAVTLRSRQAIQAGTVKDNRSVIAGMRRRTRLAPSVGAVPGIGGHQNAHPIVTAAAPSAALTPAVSRSPIRTSSPTEAPFRL